jgi:hypothetical protein
MSPVVATGLELADLMTWPPICSSPQMRSLNRWLRRRSHDKIYTVNRELLAKFTRNELILLMPAHDPEGWQTAG